MTELEELYEMYFKDVYLFSLSLSKNKYTAEDITSITFMKVLESLDKYRGDSDIKTWIFSIARNTYYSMIKKDQKLVLKEEVHAVESEVNVEKTIISQESETNIKRIINNLMEPYKGVFVLRVYGELSFKEIGEVYSKTANWACVTFHRSRKKIQEEMRESNEERL